MLLTGLEEARLGLGSVFTTVADRDKALQAPPCDLQRLSFPVWLQERTEKEACA